MKKILHLLLIFASTGLIQAQDPIFSQFYMIPEAVNSSFAGSLESTKAGIIHKVQWPGLDFSINTQFAYVDNWFEEMQSGLGISFLNHKETQTRYNFSQFNLNYVYRVQITDEWVFRPSVSFGLGSKDFGFQNLLLEDQINIVSGIINTTSIDPVRLNETLLFFDFSAGFLVHNDNSWLGVSVKHLNRPNISFTEDGNDPLNLFMSVHSSIEFPLGSGYNPDSSIYFLTNAMLQDKYNRVDIGGQFVTNQFSFAVLAATTPFANSVQSHFLTSINAGVGFKYEGFKFGYSYDFNVTDIGRTGGIFELSISYDFDNYNNCFACPKYY
jgi:type IX secretion system PorP/SprF family membrane protein